MFTMTIILKDGSYADYIGESLATDFSGIIATIPQEKVKSISINHLNLINDDN